MAAIGHAKNQEFTSFLSTGLSVELICECIYVGNGFIEVIVVLVTI